MALGAKRPRGGRARRWQGRAAVIAVLLSGAARADVVAVAPPRISGGGASLGAALRDSIAGGVAAAGHASIGSTAIDRALEATPAIAACDTDVCLARLADLVGAGAAVRAVVEVLGSSNYSFRLELVDAAQRQTIARVEDSCPICTTREAHDAISRAAATLGHKLGVSAHAVPVAPTPVTLAPEPRPAPAPRRPWPPRARLFLGFGVAATVAGIGLLAGGSALLALDARAQVGYDPVTHEPFKDTFEGKIPGAILIAGGGILVVGGGVLLWRAARARPR